MHLYLSCFSCNTRLARQARNYRIRLTTNLTRQFILTKPAIFHSVKITYWIRKTWEEMNWDDSYLEDNRRHAHLYNRGHS